MQAKNWMLPAILLAVVGVGVWSTQRLLQGKPRWNSMAAVNMGGEHAAASAPTASPSASGAPANPGTASAGDGCCPADGAAVAPAAKADGKPAAADAAAGTCPAESGAPARPGADPHAPAATPHAEHATGLPPGHPPIDGVGAASPHGHDAHPAAKDPVCGMDVTPGADVATLKHDGKTYSFCNTGCRDTFAKEPAKYLKAASAPGH